MSEHAGDPLVTAAARLEAAVERLAMALTRPRPVEDAVPRAEVEALTMRLEGTIQRLKAALREQDGLGEEGED